MLGLGTEPSHVLAIGEANPSPDPCDGLAVTGLPRPLWNTQLVGCGLPADAAVCGEGLCVAPIEAPFQDRLCITRPGAHACPAAFGVPQPQHFVGVADTRTCDSCTCGVPAGMICDTGSSYTTYASSDCSGESVSAFGDGDCSLLPDDAQSVHYKPVHPGQCSPTEQSQPQGSAVATDPITICLHVLISAATRAGITGTGRGGRSAASAAISAASRARAYTRTTHRSEPVGIEPTTPGCRSTVTSS